MNGGVQVAISADGTEIVGRVRGQGPPLVLVHGAWGDGEVAYEALVPHLADRFTCYMPSTRGRGLSGNNANHSVHRLVQDVIAFIHSIGEPVYLVGWSGIEPPLGAAAQSRAVSAVALFEPGMSRPWPEKTTSPALVPPSNALVRRRPTGASPTRLAPSRPSS